MKELHKLITKDIFDCLSEEDAGRLRELRAELHIDDEAYRQMKKMITSREVHERIMEVRKKPSRMIKMMRYAAILILPVAIAVYIFISQGNVIKPEIVVQNQVEEKLPVPVRKQAMLVLEDGSVCSFREWRVKKRLPRMPSQMEMSLFIRRKILQRITWWSSIIPWWFRRVESIT